MSEADSLLATMRVRIVNKNMHITGQARALCDSGSQLNLITIDCIQRLGLTYRNADIHVAGVGDRDVMCAKGYLDAELVGYQQVNPSVTVRLVVVSKITSAMPAFTQEQQFVDTIANTELADPEYSGTRLLWMDYYENKLRLYQHWHSAPRSDGL